jgi:peptidoglycan/LPS O-acetylase OafA/YrhL
MTGHRANNFDCTRLLAAAAVIYGHAHPLAASADPAFFGNAVQAFAVKVFFTISGYLIAASWLADPDPARYLFRRALRIFPALIAICLLTILVLGPLTTSLTPGEYFTSTITWDYLRNVLLYPVYNLPGVFEANTYPAAVNGSLWSLSVEFAMYIALPLVAWRMKGLALKATLLIATALLCAASIWWLRVSPSEVYPTVYGTNIRSALDVAPYFMIGACFQAFKEEIKLHSGIALFGVGVLLFLQPAGLWSEFALMTVGTYGILAFATTEAPVLRSAGRFGDMSYGLYLYGFPIQQWLYHLSDNRLSAWGNALISLPICLVLAWISWHGLEKWALKLKPKGKR